MKAALFITYAVSWVVVFSLVHLSSLEGHAPYDPAAAVLLTELAKLVISLSLYVARDGGVSDLCSAVARRGRVHLLPLAVPTVLYTIGNILAYHSLANTDPGTFVLLLQSRMMLTGCAHSVVFARRVHRMQWAAIWLIAFGCVSNQAPTLEHLGEHDHNLASSRSSAAWLSIFVQVCCSVAATISTEWMLKSEPPAHMKLTTNLKNAAMYTFGVLLNVGWILLRPRSASRAVLAPNTLIDQMQIILRTPLLISIVLLTAGARQLTALVLKYLDSVTKSVANGLEIVLTVIVSRICFNVHIGPSQLLGVTTIVTGVAVYSTLERLRQSPTQWAPSVCDSPAWWHLVLVGLACAGPAAALKLATDAELSSGHHEPISAAVQRRESVVAALPGGLRTTSKLVSAPNGRHGVSHHQSGQQPNHYQIDDPQPKQRGVYHTHQQKGHSGGNSTGTGIYRAELHPRLNTTSRTSLKGSLRTSHVVSKADDRAVKKPPHAQVHKE